jgi:uncharacterized protein YebE (UPF0316 family)
LVFLARIVDMSLEAARQMCETRRRRTGAIVLSLAQVGVWLFALAAVLPNLTNLLTILACVGGYTVGGALGKWVRHRLTFETASVPMVSRLRGQEVAERLRRARIDRGAA